MEVEELDDCAVEQEPVVRGVAREVPCRAQEAFVERLRPLRVRRARRPHQHCVTQPPEERPVALESPQLLLLFQWPQLHPPHDAEHERRVLQPSSPSVCRVLLQEPQLLHG